MAHARDAPDPVAHWIALFDVAQHLLDIVPPKLGAMAQVSAAIDTLLVHEHTMTADQRQAARERLWQRDQREPFPPPLARMAWGVCHCRACTLAQHTDQRRTVWQSQVQAVHLRKGR